MPCTPGGCGAVAMTFEFSLATGNMLEDWRMANVVPSFKKGNRENPGNYRPVRLMPVVCKLLERILKDTVYEHLEKYSLLKDSQHGFVKGRLCLMSLITLQSKNKSLNKVMAILDIVTQKDHIMLRFKHELCNSLPVISHDILAIAQAGKGSSPHSFGDQKREGTVNASKTIDSRQTGEMFQIERDFGDHFSTGPRVSVRSACADYRSDTTSLVSELDETDYEVRELTALAFRSLACPHNNYIDLSSSRASTDWSLSLSEDSSTTNKWSVYAELSDPGCAEPPTNSSPAPSARSEERAGHPFGDGRVECVDVAVETQEGRTVPKREIQFKKRERSELTVFRSSDVTDGHDPVQYAETAQRRESSVGREDAETKEASDRPLHRTESTEECSKKAKLASCHISNVISKKMQFEQELKMERGAIQETYSSVPSTPSSVNLKEFEFPIQEGKRRNSSAKPESEQSGEDIPALLRKRSADLNVEPPDGARRFLRQDSCGSLKGESNALDAPTNRDILERWKESNVDNQKGTKVGRAKGTSGNKPQTTLAALINDQFEIPTARSILEDTRDADCIPHAAKDRWQTSCLVESKLGGYEARAAYKQSGTKNVSEKAKLEQQVDPFGTIEQLAPNIGSHCKVITLDPKYQTLPASFKFETDDSRIKDLQFNSRESIQQRTKGPIHQVRDVRKLVKNTYGALRFSEAKSFGSVQVLQPNCSHAARAYDQTTASMDGTPTLPVYVQCKSTGWRGNIGSSNNISADKKYWTYAGSTETSRSYTNDIKLLFPLNTNRSVIGSSQRAGTVNETSKKDGKKECEAPTESTALMDSKKKMIKDDKSQILSASNKKDSRVPPMKDVNVKESKENKGENLPKLKLNTEGCSLSTEPNRFKISQTAGVEKQNSSLSISNQYTKGKKVEAIVENQSLTDKLRKDFIESVPKKKDIKVPINTAGSKREDMGKLHSEKILTGNVFNESLKMQEKADSSREIQNRLDHSNKLQKIAISTNNDTKTVVEKNEHKRVETQNKHLNTSTLSSTDIKLSTNKDKLEKGHSRLDPQKTPSKMSSLNSERTQDIIGKGQLNKESQARKRESQMNISEYSVLKTEKIKEKDEQGTESQVQVEQKRKLSGSSILNTPIGKEEDKKLIQLGQESKSKMSKSLAQTSEVTKLPGRGETKNEGQVGQEKEKRDSNDSSSVSEAINSTFGKYETVKAIQIRLENQHKVVGKSNEGKPGKIKAASESQAGQDNQKKLPGYCAQTSESKSESKKENQNDSENQVKMKVEQAQVSEKSGPKKLKEPIKDSYVLSLILEEESKNNMESTDDIRNKQQSSVKNQALKSISAQASHSSSVGVKDKQSTLAVKATNHHQTTTKTETHKFESHGNIKSTSGFATNIPASTSTVQYQDTTSQIHPSSAEFKVKDLPPINSVAKLFGQDQKISSSAIKVQSARAEITQTSGSTSLENSNYLAIPITERRSQVPNLGQTTTSPRAATVKAMPYFQHQRSLEITEPSRQEKESASGQVAQEPHTPGTSLQNPYYASSSQGQPQLTSCSPGTKPSNFAEPTCDVAQIPQETDNPGMPGFQYPQTQRKMLVDPETGSYYFVDAPVQPSRRMLLDPVTGQYVEVVMSQQPFGGVYQVPFSPYVLHPGVMGPSYLPNMPYPGLFVGPPVPSQRPLEMQSQPLPQQVSVHDKADVQHHEQSIQRTFSSESAQMETLYYIPTGMTLYPNSGQPGLQHVAMQAKPTVCADGKDSKVTGLWPIQHIYEASNYLPHARPSSFMVE
ncbi:titin homolog [Narcine bancroftii]|uniref:titin homolog n=1 Tax=Narcine bancroftii TaxID=1343680 RepID=UPI0038313BC7